MMPFCDGDDGNGFFPAGRMAAQHHSGTCLGVAPRGPDQRAESAVNEHNVAKSEKLLFGISCLLVEDVQNDANLYDVGVCRGNWGSGASRHVSGSADTPLGDRTYAETLP